LLAYLRAEFLCDAVHPLALCLFRSHEVPF
jgi:hypothetical protein